MKRKRSPGINSAKTPVVHSVAQEPFTITICAHSARYMSEKAKHLSSSIYSKNRGNTETDGTADYQRTNS